MREAVRRAVLEWHAFSAEDVIAMATEAGIPESGRRAVAAYIGQEFRGLHEGNSVRYRLRPEDLEGIQRE